MTEQHPPQLSFGATSVSALVAVVRDAGETDAADWNEIAASITTRADELVRTNRHMVQDAPSEQWLRTCSVVLAAYRELGHLVDGPRLLSLFYDAMAVPFRHGVTSYLESRFGISDEMPQHAFSQISENFQRRGEQRFGLAFRYATDVRDARRSFVNIKRCFFNDFFRANQAHEVTGMFCALDKVWAETIEQPRYGVRFERPTTLANGDDACRFQFHKIDAA